MKKKFPGAVQSDTAFRCRINVEPYVGGQGTLFQCVGFIRKRGEVGVHRFSVHFVDLRVLPRLVVGQGTGAKQRRKEKGIKFGFHY